MESEKDLLAGVMAHFSWMTHFSWELLWPFYLLLTSTIDCLGILTRGDFARHIEYGRAGARPVSLESLTYFTSISPLLCTTEIKWRATNCRGDSELDRCGWTSGGDVGFLIERQLLSNINSHSNLAYPFVFTAHLFEASALCWDQAINFLHHTVNHDLPDDATERIKLLNEIKGLADRADSYFAETIQLLNRASQSG